MANNYNGNRRIPVVFAARRRGPAVVRRETWADLLARDVDSLRRLGSAAEAAVEKRSSGAGVRRTAGPCRSPGREPPPLAREQEARCERERDQADVTIESSPPRRRTQPRRARRRRCRRSSCRAGTPSAIPSSSTELEQPVAEPTALVDAAEIRRTAAEDMPTPAPHEHVRRDEVPVVDARARGLEHRVLREQPERDSAARRAGSCGRACASIAPPPPEPRIAPNAHGAIVSASPIGD